MSSRLSSADTSSACAVRRASTTKARIHSLLSSLIASNAGAAYTRSTASLSATVRAKTHSSCSMLFMGMAFHDAEAFERPPATARADEVVRHPRPLVAECGIRWEPEPRARRAAVRSEEHTSELQSLMRISYAVSCLK